MKSYHISLSLLVVVLLMGCAPLEKPQEVSEQDGKLVIEPHSSLSVEQFLIEVEQDDRVVIDIRTPEEIAEGKVIADALEIDFYDETFKHQISQLDKERTYLLNCRSGSRSAQAVQIMKDLGFLEVYDLKGGIIAYRDYRALHDALGDEYKAYSTYENVLADFGSVRPFSNIILAEQKHINSLKELFNTYRYSIPENLWSRKVPKFESIVDACLAGIDAEINNAALYDDLLLMTQKKDILQVFKNLQAASQDKHLPAFQRCGGRI